MPETDFNLSGLNARIEELKSDGAFICEFLDCLMKRHDLQHSIPAEFEIEEIPNSILDTLRKGELPDNEEILLLSSEAQNYLILELVWACGMNAVAFYTQNNLEEIGDSVLDQVLSLIEVSPAHYVGCYLVAVFTLLMCRVPTSEMIETITNNFSMDEISIQKSYDVFLEMVAGIYNRFQEDKIYYSKNTDKE